MRICKKKGIRAISKAVCRPEKGVLSTSWISCLVFLILTISIVCYEIIIVSKDQETTVLRLIKLTEVFPDMMVYDGKLS